MARDQAQARQAEANSARDLGRAADTVIPAVALPLSLLLTFVAMRMPRTTASTTCR